MSRLAVRESAFKPVVIPSSVSRETSPRTETDDAVRRDGARTKLRPVATVAESASSEKEYWHPLAGPAPTD